MSETRRLGRGLESLLGPINRVQAEASGALKEIAVSAIAPNRFQPRREFEETALQELAASIASSGLLQPILVRPSTAGGYELIAGERRWRAVQRLGWQTVPAVVKEVDDRTALTLALIENLQRDDLSAIDEAKGYQRLIDEFDLPQAEVARLVGRDRSTINNTLRLLKLPEEIQGLVETEDLSEGHARALLATADQNLMLTLARKAVELGWSVRDLEARVRGEIPGGRPRKIKSGKVPERTVVAEIRRIEDVLRQRLATDVRVTARRRGRGFVTISYYSNDDLTRVLEQILGEPFGG
ncbi:MAG: ParB/RepB/Spo0J family partition protein [Gemmatimonadota bacterium]